MRINHFESIYETFLWDSLNMNFPVAEHESRSLHNHNRHKSNDGFDCLRYPWPNYEISRPDSFGTSCRAEACCSRLLRRRKIHIYNNEPPQQNIKSSLRKLPRWLILIFSYVSFFTNIYGVGDNPAAIITGVRVRWAITERARYSTNNFISVVNSVTNCRVLSLVPQKVP